MTYLVEVPFDLSGPPSADIVDRVVRLGRGLRDSEGTREISWTLMICSFMML